MTNIPYSHFKEQEPTPLSDARQKWGCPEIVDEVEELVRSGFSSRTRGFVDVDKQGTAQCRRHSALLTELEQLTESLLTDERLIAYGFTKDTLAGPQYILSTIWNHAKVNYEASTLEIKGQPENTITSIVVFKPIEKHNNQKPVKSKRIGDAALEKAYIEYVQELIAKDERSSREKTYKEMQKRCGKGATVKRLEPLRVKHYPKKWQGSGN